MVLKRRIDDIYDSQDKPLIDYITIYYFFTALNLFVKLYLNGFPGWEMLSRGVLGLLAVRGAWALYKSKKTQYLILPELIMLMVYIFSLVIGEAGVTRLFSSMLNVMLGYIPLGVFIYCIGDLKRLEKMLYQWSWPSLLLMIMVILRNSTLGTSSYDMSGGYGLLLPVLFFFQSFFEKKKWWDGLAGLFGAFLILIYCSRGPLLCVVIYLVLVAFKNMDFHSVKNVFKTVLIVFCLVLIAIYYQQIIEVALRYIINKGFGGRTINLLLYDITHDSGRSLMHEYYKQAIASRPFFGWGVLGGWTYGKGTYPHSIILEFELSFGLGFGVLFLLLLGTVVIDAVVSCKENNCSLVIIIVSATAYLLYSDSFMQSYVFFMCIGICLRAIRDKRHKPRRISFSYNS